MDEPNSDRRRFYLVGPDFDRNPSDFKFVNRNEVLIDGVSAGTYKVPLEGLASPRSFGLPPMRATPRLVVGAQDLELCDMYGLDKRYVSSRARELLLSIDPDAFEFAECITVDGVGQPVDPYWMTDVIRVIDCVDLERSNLVWFREAYPDPSETTNPMYAQLNELYFDNLSDGAHAFYLLRYRADFIFDGVLVDAWLRAGLTGSRFTPLQPPTESEARDQTYFQNHPYWLNQGR